MRFFPPRREPHFFTDGHNLTHPRGYEISELGPERPLEIRETQKFFALRNRVLHLIRNETGVAV